MKDKADLIKKLEECLRTPRDSTNMSNEELANLLALSFIGMIAYPTGISDELVEMCVDEWKERRGKIEWEAEAIKKVLDENRKNPL